MAKMISKFHKLIQSKMLWIVFVVVIVVGFVLLPVAANFGSRDEKRENAPGTLNGKAVPWDEYSSARSQAYLSLVMMALMYGQELDFGEDVRNYIDEAAWKRLITLRTAKELGFEAYADEIESYIRDNPLFEQEDNFDPRIYKTFKDRFLKARGFSGSEFERHVAEEIILRKTQQMVGQVAVIPPAKIDRSLRTISDEFKLEYAKVGKDLLEEEVETTEADARRVYDAESEQFTEPEQLDLKYIYFPYEEYLSEVPEFSEEELQNYYNEHIDEYRVSETEQEMATATNELEETESSVDTPKYKSFEEVEKEIREKMRIAAAKDIAIDRANEIVFELPPDRDGKAPEFDEVAEKAELEVRELAPFSVESLPDLDDSPELVAKEAEELRQNADEYFSDALPGEEGVYILALEEKIADYIPPFEEVEDEAFAVAREQNIEQALDQKVSDIQDEIEEGLQAGKSFEEMATELGLSPESTEAFTLQEASEVLPEWLNAQEVSQRLVDRNPGEFVDPLPLEDGERLLAYVAERESGSLEDQNQMRENVYQSLMEDRVSRLYEDWQEYLLEKADFKDNTAVEDE